MTDANGISVAVFTALGTIVGYLGAETASSSIFERQLWPTRFYNTSSYRSLAAIALLMPCGGPIHRAAVEALDNFTRSGLWRGYCRGDMLGTAFFKDTKQKYIVHSGPTEEGETVADARNAFWITVLDLVPWQKNIENPGPSRKAGVEEAGSSRETIRSRRPIFSLRLTYAQGKNGAVSVVDGDVGNVKPRHIAALLASETVTLAFGIVVAAVWRSLFALWFLAPLLLKVLGLVASVRRESMRVQSTSARGTKGPLSEGESGQSSPPLSICSSMTHEKGFMLIHGPSLLLTQFFKHYGHPIRHRRGLKSDRAREVASMIIVILIALVYPAGLLLFIFARQGIQWTWLAYELYTMFAMHMYRFANGEFIGTTQYRIARELGRGNTVSFSNSIGQAIIAVLEKGSASTIREGTEEMNRRIDALANEPTT